MQAAGVEVGLVAKLVGHANANVTLSHYTHAMRVAMSPFSACRRCTSPCRTWRSPGQHLDMVCCGGRTGELGSGCRISGRRSGAH